MKLYDISQELFSSVVYPGDPAPKKTMLSTIEEGAPCNVTFLTMCAHNGTHLDAPLHFVDGGKAIDEIPLSVLVGPCYLFKWEGEIGREDAREMLKQARAKSPEAARRILVGGRATLTKEAAEVFVKEGVILYGNESQTVGPENAPMEVHLVLLGAGCVLLEGIRTSEAAEGEYLLSAAPINLGGSDGSPVRALLIDGVL